MKPSKIFWGTFFISLGVLLLIFNIERIPQYFEFIWYLWPLVFIFWGISLLKVSLFIKQILAALSGLLIALTIIGGFGTGFKYVSDNENFWEKEFSKFDINLNKNVEDSTLCTKLDSSYKFSTLYIEGGVGHYQIKDTTNSWIRLITNNFSDSIISCDSSNKLVKLILLSNYNFVEDGFKREALIKLNAYPIWTISIQAGAVLFNCDLSQFKVKKMDVQTGVSKIKITLGDKLDSTQLNISSGLSSVIIEIPQKTGCMINSETGLTKKHFSEFLKIDKNTYATSNFYKAEKKIFINISSGLSSFKVKRY